MLVLTRQRNEKIMIGDDVEVTIVDIRGDKVRLGIEAPRKTEVHRKEVFEAKKRSACPKERRALNNDESPPPRQTVRRRPGRFTD